MIVRLAMALGAGLAVAAAFLAVSVVFDWPSRTFYAEVVVEAPRGDIWRTLTDFGRYDEWNPHITSASGHAVPGATVVMSVRGRNGETEEIEAEVEIVDPWRKIEWRSRRFAPGLLDRERTFRVLPMDTPGRWRVTHVLRVEGLGTPFVDRDEERATGAAMVDALRRHLTSGG